MKKSLFFCALSALLFSLFQAAVNAETYTLPAAPAPALGYGDTGIVNTNGIYTGVWLDNAAPQWWDTTIPPGWKNIAEADPAPAGRNVYNILTGSTISITGVNKDDGSVSAILTNDRTGTFNLGHINISGAVETGDHTLYGFLYLDDASFNGTINGGNVTVSTTNGSEIVGVYFRVLTNGTGANGGNKQNLGADTRIAFNDIKVTAGTATTAAVDGAAGFAAGAVANGAVITLRSVESKGAWGTGLEFAGPFQGTLEVKGTGSGAGVVEATATENESRGLLLLGGTDAGAKINITSITVTAGKSKEFGYSYGIEVGHIDPTDAVPQVTSNLKDTEIYVTNITASGTQASGIFVTGDIDNATINIGSAASVGSITATASSGYAVGFDVDGDILTSDITITGTMNVTSTSSIAHAIDIGKIDFVIDEDTGKVVIDEVTGRPAIKKITGGNVVHSTLSITGNITAETGGAEGTSVAGISVVGIEDSEITAGGTITALTTGSGGTAVGIGVWNGIKGDGKIDANSIVANAASGDAAGIVVYNTNHAASCIEAGSSITSGTITASARGKVAGMELNGNMDGEIKVNGSISVTSTNSTVPKYPEGSEKEGQNNYDRVAAYGIDTRGTLGKTTVSGSISANSTSGNAFGVSASGKITDNITVSSTITANGGHDATGFSSTGGLDAVKTVDLKNISVRAGSAPTVDSPTSTGNEAVGVHFSGDVLGTLKTGDITVASHGGKEGNSGHAFGVIAKGGLADTDNKFGKITVTANNPKGEAGKPTAAGIWTTGDSFFTLSGNIKVESAAYSVVEDKNNNKTLKSENSGTDTANYGIFVQNGNAEITLADFSNITVSATGAAKNVDVKVAGNLTVKGSDMTDTAANLGVVEVDGKFTIDGGSDESVFSRTSTITLDIAKSTLGGTNEITNNAKLNVYGDGKAAGYSNGQTAATFTGISDTNFKNIDIAHIWSLSGENIIYGGIRSSASMSDGRLAALSMHHRYAAWNSVRDRMISGNAICRRGYEWRGYRGQCYDSCEHVTNYDPNPCDPRALYSVNGGDARAWVNYTGRGDAYWSNFHERNWKLTMGGVQAGTDLWRTRCDQIGILFGYEEGKMTNIDDQVKVKDPYFGIYAARVFYNGADIRGVFAYGWQDYNMRRVEGVEQDRELYRTRFKGNTTESHIELGKRMSAGSWSLRPVFGVDMLTNNLGKEWESSDIFYGKTHLTQVFLRAGADLRCMAGYFLLNSGVYYSYDVHERAGKELRTSIVTEDDLRLPLYGSKLGRSLLTFNAGGACQISECFSLIGGYNGEYAFDRSHGEVQHSGYAGGAWQW